MILIGNVPLFALGWRHLGGRRFMARTVTAVVLYAVLLDGLVFILPDRLTDDSLLNALYGGVLGGIGMGLVFRGQGTSGGTTTSWRGCWSNGEASRSARATS